MIRYIVNSLYHRYNRCPPCGAVVRHQQRSRSAGLPGQYRKPEGCLPGSGTYSYPELSAGGFSVRENV